MSETKPDRVEIEPWPRGRCEFIVSGSRVGGLYSTPAGYCGKRGRWMRNREIRCGEHKNE